MDKKDGYYGGVDDSYEDIGGLKFVRSDRTAWIKTLDEQDLARAKKAIYEAKLQADYIMISVHSHTMGAERQEPDSYLKDFAHFCIDQGAHAVVGHGPHLLRPIEIYKGRPIFYSLGDFIIQLYNVEIAPPEFYEQYGLTADATVHELLKNRSKNFTIGLMTNPVMFETVIPFWEFEGEDLKSLKIYPVLVSMTGKKSEIGLPRLAKDTEFLNDFLHRCELYGTKFEKNEDGSLSWKK